MHKNVTMVNMIERKFVEQREKNPADMPKKHDLSQFTMP